MKVESCSVLVEGVSCSLELDVGRKMMLLLMRSQKGTLATMVMQNFPSSFLKSGRAA